MFCHKCGNQITEGSAFCPKCGAKLIADDTTQKTITSTPAKVQPRANDTQTNIPNKKKSKKLPMILGAVALIFVVIIIAVNFDDIQERGEQARKDEEYIASQQQSAAIDLSETYTNDAAGITFNYPDGWKILDSGSEFVVVEMIDSKNTADHIAKFNVNIILDQDPYGVFTQDEAAVREIVNESNTFIKFGETLIGDVPAKGLTYQTSGLKGDDIVTNFWYAIGNNVYQITCSYSKSTANTYEPIFNAIMDSYTITTANTSGESGILDKSNSAGVTTNGIAETTDQVLFYDIPVQDIIGMTKEDVIANFGEPDTSTEDYINYGSDTSEWMEFGFLFGNEVSGFSASPENFTFNGQSLDQNYDTMLTILGEDCVEQGGTTYVHSTAWAYGGCQISFRFPTYRNETEDDRVMDVSVYPIG